LNGFDFFDLHLARHTAEHHPLKNDYSYKRLSGYFTVYHSKALHNWNIAKDDYRVETKVMQPVFLKSNFI